jgi:hypothetical protein
MRNFHFLQRLHPDMLSSLIIGAGWGIASLALLPIVWLWDIWYTLNFEHSTLLYIAGCFAIFEAVGFGITAAEVKRRWKKLDWLHLLAVVVAIGGISAILATLHVKDESSLISLFAKQLAIAALGSVFIGLSLRRSLPNFGWRQIIPVFFSWSISPLIQLGLAMPCFAFVAVLFYPIYSQLDHIVTPIHFLSIPFTISSSFAAAFVSAWITFSLVQDAIKRYQTERERQKYLMSQKPQITAKAAPGKTLQIVESREPVDAKMRRKLGL